MAKAQVTNQMVRLSEPWRAHLRALLNDPIMREAIETVREQYNSLDVDTNAPEIASVRALSARAGFESFPIKLRALTDAPLTARTQLEETWGTTK